MIETLLDMGIKDFRVLDAMSQVPRHIFVDNALQSRAYENRSLTIGYKQTISQPYIVAKMTAHLISPTKSKLALLLEGHFTLKHSQGKSRVLRAQQESHS